MTVTDTTHPDPLRHGGFTTSEAAQAAGVTFRQLDYWSRTGALRAVYEARGSGSRRQWSPDQIRLIRAMGRLRDLGCPLDRAAGIVIDLAEIPAAEWNGRVILADWVLDLASLADS